MARPNPKHLSPPWRPTEPCPCGSGRRFGECCADREGVPRGSVPNLVPPGTRTGYANERCYLRGTSNCCDKITREHFISRAILNQLAHMLPGETGGPRLELDGMLWQQPGTSGRFPPDALAAKVLCRRHNSALAPLDAIAADAFSRLAQAFHHASRDSLSVRTQHFLVNGEALQLWGLKTLLGVYHAKVAAAERTAVRETHQLDERWALAALSGSSLPQPLGLYISASLNELVKPQVALGFVLNKI